MNQMNLPAGKPVDIPDTHEHLIYGDVKLFRENAIKIYGLRKRGLAA